MRRFDGAVTYHDSCSGLRELGVKRQPRQLLKSVEGLTLVEMNESDVCCGFGGTFAVKYGDISGQDRGEEGREHRGKRRARPCSRAISAAS
jgi:Fe-S oxidoreductase